ncbi:acetyl-CoA carboxylase biotin carboxylase subunit family protein [Streptomyces sp. NPDC001435]|uniref:ATP-grasp domain-containing protein n=1 Tax=Streptomyces sp. NPDC001435 TaxID=3364576 RepID=UPI0036933C96
MPRLTESYDVHVLWAPTGDEEKDKMHARTLNEFCENTPLLGEDDSLGAIIEFCRKWQPEGILGFSELVVSETHAAALELGLPANSRASLPALRSKEEQRLALAQAGAPGPRFSAVSSLAELVSAVAEVGMPAVLKPSVGVSSMATYRITPEVDLAELWENATGRYKADPRGDGSAHFVLEEMLIGEQWHDDPRLAHYVSVESLVQNGSIIHLVVTDKFPLSQPFRENGNLMPSTLPERRISAILECATQAISAIGITNSMVHTEVMLTASGPRIIEVNSRLGGAVIEMLHLCFDYDIVTAMAAVATGREIAPLGPPLRSSGQYIPQAPARDVTLSKVPTVDELMALEEVVEAEVFCRVGDSPDWQRGTSAGRLARVIAASESVDRLLALADIVRSDEVFSYLP